LDLGQCVGNEAIFYIHQQATELEKNQGGKMCRHETKAGQQQAGKFRFSTKHTCMVVILPRFTFYKLESN
jgi:hypothetical protein